MNFKNLLHIKNLFLVFLVFSFFAVNAQKTIEGFVYIPSNNLILEGKSVKVSDFYIAENEVTNKMYQEFLTDLVKLGRGNELSKLNIDTNLWKIAKVTNGDLYAMNYHHWNDFPVVNVSYEAAEVFCAWFTERLKKEGVINDKSSVRLPKMNEWVLVAKDGNDKNIFPFEQNNETFYDVTNPRTQIKCLGNFWGPVKVKSFKPNKLGVYDMAGSVAEMISDFSLVKGGSWNTNLDQTRIDNSEPLNISPMVGFRLVIEIIK